MDLLDYWNEYKIIEESPPASCPDEEPALQDEGEEAREWLVGAGLGPEVEAAEAAGREVGGPQVLKTLAQLTMHQAAAVARRLDTLNSTIRARTKPHQPKPHVRDLFKDLDNQQGWSSDSRSRSATPDSLGSPPPSPPNANNLNLKYSPGGVAYKAESRKRAVANSRNAVLPHHALFRRASRSGGDIVASETADGIKMVGYQRLGSVRVRTKSESDPASLNSLGPPNSPKHQLVCVTRSHDSLYERRQSGGSSPRSDTPGFEEMWANENPANNINNNDWEDWEEKDECGRTRVDFLAEEDMATLRPLLFVELTAIMDQASIRVGKLKQPKRKRKQEGLLFGLSLSTLLEKDTQLVSEPHSVPLVFQKVLGELERRGLSEEGVLRVGGKRQRVEALCSSLERLFYTRPEQADHLVTSATPHELVSLLKRLIRSAPEPLLTTHLLPLFYQAHRCPGSLNLLVLLLPTEHRATLRALLQFLSSVARHEAQNKMSLRNVAMIMAPSLLPPHCLGGGDLGASLGVAVESTRVAEALLTSGDKLWMVPRHLIAQLRRVNSARERPQVVPVASHLEIHAPQFLLEPLRFRLDPNTTAAHVILRVVEMGSREAPLRCCARSGRRDAKARALSELAPNGNLSCLLSTGDPDTALQTHFLYEVGGNIGQRRLEPGASLLAVYQCNPHAEWVVKCDHRNGSHRILKRV